MMGGEEGFSDAWGDAPGAADLAMAWDEAERYAVTLLWEALPEAQAVPVPVEELAVAVARFRSSARKWPYRQLARAAWGRRPSKPSKPSKRPSKRPNWQQPGDRSPAEDADLWLDAAGAPATMRHHVDIDTPLLAPVALLRPVDWAGGVIGMVRSGVNSIVTAWDLAGYARQCPQIGSTKESGDEAAAYDPFAGDETDDETLRNGFEAALLLWEAIGAVNEQRWLTRLGFWGLPRALARAWNGDFDKAAWMSTELDGRQGSWPGQAPSPADLGIREPPVGI